MKKFEVDIKQLFKLLEQVKLDFLCCDHDIRDINFFVIDNELHIIRFIAHQSLEVCTVRSEKILVKASGAFMFSINYEYINALLLSLMCQNHTKLKISCSDNKLIIESEQLKFIDEPKCWAGGFIDCDDQYTQPTIPIPNYFFDVIKKSYSSLDESTLRENIDGMLFSCKDGKFNVVATNGHILSVSEFTIPFIPNNSEFNIFVSKENILNIIRFGKLNRHYEITGGFYEGIYLSSSIGHKLSINSKNVDFPDWKKIIKNTPINKSLVKIEKIKLQRCFKFIHEFTKNSSGNSYCTLDLIFTDNLCEMIIKKNNYSYSNKIPVDMAFGACYKTKVNFEYFFRSVNSIDGDIVKISIADSLIFLETTDSHDYRRIVMPMAS